MGAAAAVALNKIGQVEMPPDIDASIRRAVKGRTSRQLRRVAEDLKAVLRAKSRTTQRGGLSDGRHLSPWQATGEAPEPLGAREALRLEEQRAAEMLRERGAEGDSLGALIDPGMWRGLERDRRGREAGARRGPSVRYGPEQVAAYAVQRLPACYAALCRVFGELRGRDRKSVV